MIDLVIGGQFGSEGKGSVVSWLARNNDYDIAIRIGGANAGHTFRPFDQDPPVKMRHIPACWDNVDMLHLGSGAVIDKDVLWDELRMVKTMAGDINSFSISPYATVITDVDRAGEKQLVKDIGSTGEGVGAARAARIMRKSLMAKDVPQVRDFCRDIETVDMAINLPESRILIETTQGVGLSLTSPFYPFCTSTNINVYQALSDADIPFGLHMVNVYMVMRVFPIRVAGTSGALLNETTWEALQEKYGSHIPIERTTVTDKVRRVGGFDYSLYHTAHRLCNPTAIFLTFADYLVPEWHDEEGNIGKWDIPKFSQELYNIVALVPETAYLGTGIGRFKTLYDKSRNDVSVEESCD